MTQILVQVCLNFQFLAQVVGAVTAHVGLSTHVHA